MPTREPPPESDRPNEGDSDRKMKRFKKVAGSVLQVEKTAVDKEEERLRRKRKEGQD